jgi:hypothetical protein
VLNIGPLQNIEQIDCILVQNFELLKKELFSAIGCAFLQ